MNQNHFNTRFTGAVLALGGIMVALGYWMRPAAVATNFQVDNFFDINNAMTIWIRSFQILVFGLFIRLAGLVALGTLHENSSARPVLFAGIAICAAALLVSALSEGYYMHVGAWGAYEIQQATGDGAREAFLAGIRPTNEWVVCLARMGNMFFCFGVVILGLGLIRGGLIGKWLGAAAGLIGAAGMMTLMMFPDNAKAYLPVSLAITLWYMALGTFMLPASWRGFQKSGIGT